MGQVWWAFPTGHAPVRYAFCKCMRALSSVARTVRQTVHTLQHMPCAMGCLALCVETWCMHICLKVLDVYLQISPVSVST